MFSKVFFGIIMPRIRVHSFKQNLLPQLKILLSDDWFFVFSIFFQRYNLQYVIKLPLKLKKNNKYKYQQQQHKTKVIKIKKKKYLWTE